jgi:hypothetical protein
MTYFYHRNLFIFTTVSEMPKYVISQPCLSGQ